MSRSRRILVGLGYTAWFAFVFTTLTWLTFPWSKVRDQVVVAAHQGGTNLQMDGLSAGPFGAKVKGLSVGPVATSGEAPVTWVTADVLKLKTGPFAMMRTAMEYRAIASEGRVKTGEMIQRLVGAAGSTGLVGDVYGGSLDAQVDGDAKSSRFELEGKGLDVSGFPMKFGMFKADPSGALDSNIDVIWNWDDPRKTSGTVDLEFSKLVLDKLPFGFPTASFDRAEAHLRIKSGKAEFRDTAFESEVASAEVGGFVTLRKNLMRSNLSLNVKFRVKAEFDNLLSMAVGKNPRHKDDEGWYHYQILGTLVRPRPKAAPIGGRGKASKRTPPPSLPPQNDDDDDEPKSRVNDRRSRKTGDAVDRSSVGDDKRRELEERRERLREERRARRERQREARRQRALERASQIDPNALEDIQPQGLPDDFERTNEPALPDDVEVEGDFNDGDGDFGDGGDGDFGDGGDGSDGDYQD